MSLRQHRGFSLIELMVVVLVAGLLLAITTPSINRYLIKARLRDAGSRIAGEIRLARHKAVANSSRVWFWTSNGTNTYWIGEQRWRGGDADSSLSFASTAWKGPYLLPSTVLVNGTSFGGLNYFWYTPDGRPSNSGSMRLISTVGAPDTVTLNVDLSGAVWK